MANSFADRNKIFVNKYLPIISSTFELSIRICLLRGSNVLRNDDIYFKRIESYSTNTGSQIFTRL